MLLGAGTRLFEHDRDVRVELERTKLIETTAATRLSYRVVR